MMSKVGRTGGRNVEVQVTRRQADENGRVFLFVYGVEQEDVPFAAKPTADVGSGARQISCDATDTDTDSYIDLGSGSSVAVSRALCPDNADGEGLQPGSAINQQNPLVVQIDFLGAPSTKKVCGDDGDAACSSLTVTTHEDNSAVAMDDGTAEAKAVFQDEQGRALPGFVDFEVMGDADVLIKASSLKNHRESLTKGVASITVKGLPESDSSDPYKIAITATLASGAGTHAFNKNISRIGDAEMVTAMTYRCDPDNVVKVVEAGGEATQAVTGVGLCEIEAKALSEDDTKDPSPAVVFAPNSYFLIHSTAEDSLGQDKKTDVAFEIEEQPAAGEDAAFKDPVEVRDAGNARISGSGENGFLMVMVPKAEDIETGSYDFEIVADAGDAMTTVTITVAGKPMAHEVTGPDWISINGLETYTVTLTDENGNVPVLPAKDDQTGDMCQVIILVQTSVADIDVQTTGLDENNCLVIDPDTGMGEFKVLAPFGASHGNAVRVTALRGGDAEIKTVMIGDAPSEPGMPMNVMAMATSHDMITVSWESPAADGGSDITGYMVQSAYMMADDMMSDWMDVDPAHMGMDMMYMDSGLMAETTYYYRVVAMNSDGMGEYSDGMAMAMTMMMPPMELGAAMDLTAMPNDDGSITLMWTRGDNATHHFVSGNVLAVWEFADGMNMHTVSADQMVSGTEYSFYVTSGRFMKADDGTWPGEWSSAGWTNVAKAMAQ